MARENVVLHEEEDLGTAMLKLPIPFELNQLPIDYGFTDGLKEIEDPNFMFKDYREIEEPNHTYNKPIEDSNNSKLIGNSSENINSSKLIANSSNPPTATRIRNKRGRPKKQQSCKSAASLIDSKVDIPNKSCSHCGTTKTPLWREGPRGAGTLCNACGMQYRKGRLLPEYRPASSPNFKPNVHSNFHRKVMEIRRERNSPPSSFGFQGFQH